MELERVCFDTAASRLAAVVRGCFLREVSGNVYQGGTMMVAMGADMPVSRG